MRKVPSRIYIYLGLLFGLIGAHLWDSGADSLLAAQHAPADSHGEVSSDAGHGAAGGGATAHGEEGAEHGHAGLINELLVALMVILVGAKLGGAIFEQFKQPAVLGELLFGILIGNLGLVGFHGLDFLKSNVSIMALSELGVIILLFEVGLESNLKEMSKVGMSSLLVATLGVVTPFVLGWGVGRWLLPHEPTLVHVFIGATLCATSVGITARVLKDLGQLNRSESRIILGAAVIDDVMGLVILAVVSGLIAAAGSGAELSMFGILLIMGKAVAFLVGALFLGTFLAPKLFKVASVLRVQHMLLVTSLGICFLLARVASEIQLAPIVGAFAAGLILDPLQYKDLDMGEHRIEELLQPISGFLVPIFFVVTGMNVDLTAINDGSIIGLAAALTAAALIGKQVCGFGVLEKGLDRLSVGLGMIPRGEVGLIFANIGLGLRILGEDGRPEPVVNAGVYSAIIVVVMVTTLVTPPLLKWSMLRSDRRGESAEAAS